MINDECDLSIVPAKFIGGVNDSLKMVYCSGGFIRHRELCRINSTLQLKPSTNYLHHQFIWRRVNLHTSSVYVIVVRTSKAAK